MPLRFQPNRNSGAVALRVQTAYSSRTISGWTEVTTGTYTVQTTDYRLWVEVNPCTITFPLASTMTHDVMIKDAAGGAAANNIHTAFTGGESCDTLTDVKVTSNYGFIIIGPKPVGSGYTKTG